MSAPAPFRDRLVGALLGSALGDALGMPVEGLSHQNVRSYYKGVKGLTADDRRGDLTAGQGTADTQRMRALARALTAAPPDSPEAARQAFERELADLDLRRPGLPPGPSSACAAAAAPLGVQARLRGLADLAAARWGGLLFRSVDPHPEAHVASAAQVAALRLCLRTDPEELVDGPVLIARSREAALAAERILGADDRVSRRLATLASHLDDTPLDLQDLCHGTGSAADEAMPFAVAMVARAPDLPEATLLSAVNVGGDAAAVGAMVGALLGALHGAAAFPPDWRTALEDADAIRAEALALAEALGG